jgi:glycosyltransferase involved in cell wall biosynthesis
MTVVQVVPDLQPGGTVNHTIEIAEALTRLKHRAIIVSEGGRLQAAAERAGATVIKLPVATKNPSQIVSNAKKLAELSRDLNADLLHAQSRAPAWSCLLAQRISKIPFIATYDGSFSERNPLKRFYNSVMVRGARVIAPGERLAKMIEQRYGTAREKISVVPHAIDFEAFNPANVDPAKRALLADRWGIAPNDRVILLPGRLSRPKAPHVLVEAASRLREAGFKDFHLHLRGRASRAAPAMPAKLWDRRASGGSWPTACASPAIATICFRPTRSPTSRCARR